MKGEFLYKVRTKLMSWFKECAERGKTSFLKGTAENADLHKAALNKTMTTQE